MKKLQAKPHAWGVPFWRSSGPAIPGMIGSILVGGPTSGPAWWFAGINGCEAFFFTPSLLLESGLERIAIGLKLHVGRVCGNCCWLRCGTQLPSWVWEDISKLHYCRHAEKSCFGICWNEFHQTSVRVSTIRSQFGALSNVSHAKELSPLRQYSAWSLVELQSHMQRMELQWRYTTIFSCARKDWKTQNKTVKKCEPNKVERNHWATSFNSFRWSNGAGDDSAGLR